MGLGKSAVFAAMCCVVVMAAGCAGLTEAGRGIAGVSTKVLEDGRKNAIKRSFAVDHAKCLEIVNGVLADSKVYVYARKDAQKMIAFYMTQADTTPVGVFFTVKGPVSTEVAVSSPSRYAKEFIADKIFARFDKILRTVEDQAK
jgi:hypothetical protein